VHQAGVPDLVDEQRHGRGVVGQRGQAEAGQQVLGVQAQEDHPDLGRRGIVERGQREAQVGLRGDGGGLV
jgi:hypothetical protein